MPDPAPAPEAPMEFSENSFLEMAAAASAPVAEPPPPAPAPAAGEPAAPVQVIELEAPPGPGSALPPAPAAAPAPAAGAEPPAPAPAAPAPADANALNPDAPRNYRIQAQDAIEQRTLQLRAQNRDLTLPAALEQAYKELGLPAPFTQPTAPAPAAPAAPEPAPQAPVDALAQIEADIATREQALNELNPALDAAEWNRINAELRKLERQAATEVAQRAAQSQMQQVSAQQAMQQVETALRSEYSVLSDANHPFTIAFEQRRAQVYQTGTDEQLSDLNLEINLARQIEQDFQTRYGMAVRTTPSSSPAAQPQAQALVTQPPAPPAVAPVPAAMPRSAAAPLSGAPASVSPVTGIIPPNPLGQVQQTLQSATQGLTNADDFGDALLNAAYNGGQGAPAFDPFGIRMAA